MRPSNIAYPNLRAEMGRKNLGIVEMAAGLKYNRDTLARKLSRKSHLDLAEAFDIQEKYFPECKLRYLFALERNE